LKELAAKLIGIDSADVAAAKQSLRTNGYKADAYGHSAAEWLDLLFSLAAAGLSANEQHYLLPLSQLVSRRQTVLDALHPQLAV